MSKVTAKYAENLLSGKECQNCLKNYFCEKRNKILYGTCVQWKEILFEDMIKIVRLGYPNTIRSKIISEPSMKKSNDKIFYIKPEKTDDNKTNN